MPLNAADDLEQVAGAGIAGRPEHAHQTLGRPVREGAQFLEFMSIYLRVAIKR